MAILMIGGTGQVGSQVVTRLAKRTGDIRVLSQNPEKAKVPDGVSIVKGDVLEPDSLRAAMNGVDTLFVLNPVVADESTRGLLTLRIAADAGVKGIVFFSMVNADTFADTPHASAKYAAELMIRHFSLPATILRPNCFYQNDVMVLDPLRTQGVYAMPIGDVGLAMADTGDIADVAVHELLRRVGSSQPLATEQIEISGPEILTGTSVASIWSDVLGRPVTYAGDDIGPLQQQTAASGMPAAMALDVALMFRGFQRDGMLPSPGAVDRVAGLLGRPLRTYRSFAEEQAAAWGRSGGGAGA